MIAVSVVIPCYATPDKFDEAGQQLWYTVNSARASLEASGVSYEIVAVMNGTSDGTYPALASFMHEAGDVRVIFCGTNVDSPQAARHVGVEHTTGAHIFCLDAHVLVPPGFFAQILADMSESGADFMGTGHRFIGPRYYAARIAWDEFLWAREVINVPPLGAGKLFRSAIHAHGAFAITREAYRAVGGYWLELHGFGGEETQLCLKLWLMGRTVWVTPRTYHFHWLLPGCRRKSELWTDLNFARNFLLVAGAYADAERVKRSYESLRMLYWGNEDLFPMLSQMVVNSRAVAAERAVIEERGKFKSLDELRAMFNREDILN